MGLCAMIARSPKSETIESRESTAHLASDSLLLQPEEINYLKKIKQITY